MPSSDAYQKADRLYRLQKLYEEPGQRLRTRDIVEKLGVSEDTVIRYIGALASTGRLVLEKQGHYWVVAQDRQVEHLRVSLNLAEATALYAAGRLLAQIHDEQNRHVTLALTKLVDAMPDQLRQHQYALVALAEERQKHQKDLSAIFEALALGWAKQQKVQLLYVPPHKKKFACLFEPYLLEPSGIGHTIYAIGKSTPPGALRTYKLERIESASLTEESFEVPGDFDGAALLSRAWRVMYGDEDLIEVHLHFSLHVTQRVKETLWHPSQSIEDTPDGCEWKAWIGDTLEIENWIRGWGSDCEVIAPQELRNTIVDDLRRATLLYGIETRQANDLDEPDDDLLRGLL
jgi:predicted DNA-binding transcriptional regulator YafY